MEATFYENSYACIETAKRATRNVMAVVDFLKRQTKPVTCQDIGKALFGDAYKWTPDPYYGRGGHLNHAYLKHISDLGHILSHLFDEGCITRTKEYTDEFVTGTDGKPLTYQKWIEGESGPRYIDVWDAKGNKYSMENPNWYRGGHYEEMPIRKSIITYSWVEGK